MIYSKKKYNNIHKSNKCTRRRARNKWGGGTPTKNSIPTDDDDDEAIPIHSNHALTTVLHPRKQQSFRFTPEELKRIDMIRNAIVKRGTTPASRNRSLASSRLAHNVMRMFITGSDPSHYIKKLTHGTGTVHQKLLKNMVQTNYMPIIGERGSVPGKFNRPQCIALDRDGNIAVGDTGNNRIQVINPFTGACLRVISGVMQPDSFTFTFDNAGGGIKDEIIVLDFNGVNVLNYVDGSRIRTVNYANTEMSSPESVVYDGAIQLRFSGKLNYYTKNGVHDPDSTVKIPGRGPMAYYTKNKTKIYEPIIVSDAANGILYETMYGSVDEIWEGGIGSAPGQFAGIGGIAVDCVGNVIATDKGNNRIQIFDPGFSRIRTFGKLGNVAHGEFNAPTGVATDCHGNIFVCDTGNHRIQVLRYKP